MIQETMNGNKLEHIYKNGHFTPLKLPFYANDDEISGYTHYTDGTDW
jgi:hypothetical protein